MERFHGYADAANRLRPGAPGLTLGSMSPLGLAVFVFVAFLVPVPLIHWLDSTGRDEPDRETP